MRKELLDMQTTTENDLVLFLKGLVLVRGVREAQEADADELGMFDAEIARVRRELARAGDLTGGALSA